MGTTGASDLCSTRSSPRGRSREGNLATPAFMYPPGMCYIIDRCEDGCRSATRKFEKGGEMRTIVLTDAEARDKAARSFFNRAVRCARENIIEGALL